MKYGPEVKAHEQANGTLRATKRDIRKRIAQTEMILRRGLTIKGCPMKPKEKRDLEACSKGDKERLESLS